MDAPVLRDDDSLPARRTPPVYLLGLGGLGGAAAVVWIKVGLDAAYGIVAVMCAMMVLGIVTGSLLRHKGVPIWFRVVHAMSWTYIGARAAMEFWEWAIAPLPPPARTVLKLGIFTLTIAALVVRSVHDREGKDAPAA